MTPMIRIEDIIDRVEKYHQNADTDVIRQAYVYSAMIHKEQIRKSGEPYLIHPLEVASILCEMKLDPTSIAVGLLHDVVEDSATSIDEIEKYFGTQIAHIVDGVTKIILLTPLAPVSYDSDVVLFVNGFASAILAGLKRPVLALAGGVTLGIAEALVAGYLKASYQSSLALLLALVILIVQGVRKPALQTTDE